ncbi:AAA family ATPase [Paenibacillus sp. NPDC058071]|uniref:AAA family ATPase n=1 Tax=Paenibacillus sp. NPDC058071 TaxID=3346326 RepID=UPI0036DB91A2
MPFLQRISFEWDKASADLHRYPFNIEALRRMDELEIEGNVTFFIGENGSGKSTLLESLALLCGFNTVGGQHSLLEKEKDDMSLSSVMSLSWMLKVNNGFFFRAETFNAFADYIDELAKDPWNEPQRVYQAYGGKSLNEQSHGQAFLSLFKNRLGGAGIYLLDEPESALSPQNQLAFMRIIWELERAGNSQFIIATHSPILLAYPGATILSFDRSPIGEIDYEETDHYRLTKEFLNDRGRYFRTLFEE